MKYNNKNTKIIELSELFKNYAPAYHNSWGEWLEEADPTLDTHLGKLIRRLCKELEDFGEFNNPIVAGEIEESTGQPNNDKNAFKYIIVNGMHRIAAAYHSNLSEIIVMDEKTWMKIEEPQLTLEAEFTTTNSLDSYEELLEILSRRHTNGRWIEAESASTNHNTLTVTFFTAIQNYSINFLKDFQKIITEALEEEWVGEGLELETVGVKLYYSNSFL